MNVWVQTVPYLTEVYYYYFCLKDLQGNGWELVSIAEEEFILNWLANVDSTNHIFSLFAIVYSYSVWIWTWNPAKTSEYFKVCWCFEGYQYPIAEIPLGFSFSKHKRKMQPKTNCIIVYSSLPRSLEAIHNKYSWCGVFIP